MRDREGSKNVEGNGQMTTATRTTTGYDKVDLTGAMDVELVKGTEGRLRIEAEENLIPHITTEVKNGELVISVEKGFNLQPSRNNPIKVTVPFESLDGVYLTGSGDIYTSDMIKSASYTNLTLPTIYSVYPSMVAASLTNNSYDRQSWMETLRLSHVDYNRFQQPLARRLST